MTEELEQLTVQAGGRSIEITSVKVKDLPAVLPSCRECHWAVFVDLGEWWCHAPAVAELLDLGNRCTPCHYAREFRTVCGASGRYFMLREGEVNGCLVQDSSENSGHSALAQAPQR